MRVALILALILGACSKSKEPGGQAPAPKERRKREPPPAPASGALKLTVRGAQGPVEGAAVWVDEVAGAVKPKASTLSLGAEGLSTALLVLAPGSAISVQNKSGAARTLSMRALDAAAEAPALASRGLPVGGLVGLQVPASGIVELSCAPEPCGQTRIVIGAAGAVTDASGLVTLSGLGVAPARVHVWHPTLGRVDQTVDVVADKESALELVLP